jgi:hypothetical protein
MKLLLRAIRARWRLTMVLAGLIAIGLGAGVVLVPWTTRGEASVVFLSSRIVSKQSGGNPYLVFASSLTVSAEVVGRKLMDDQTVQAMRRQGFTAAYVVQIAPDSAGPVLSITVTSTDPKNTEATLKALEAAVDSQLDALQSGIRPDARIMAQVVSSTQRPLRVSRPKIQLLGEFLIAGLGLSAGLLLLLQALADRRRSRADRAVSPSAPTAPQALVAPRTPQEPAPPAPPGPPREAVEPVERPRAQRPDLVDYESFWLQEDEDEAPSPAGRDRADDHA